MRVLLPVVLNLAGIVIGVALQNHYKPAPKPVRIFRPM
jgi:hypothetical protein